MLHRRLIVLLSLLAPSAALPLLAQGAPGRHLHGVVEDLSLIHI